MKKILIVATIVAVAIAVGYFLIVEPQEIEDDLAFV
jgi:hypothetical protein